MTDLRPALRELFGFDDFRPGQEAVVRAALDGVDTLAVMPTGAGKSLTYQLAAMLRPSPTLVLSPLIALMKDQVDKLPPLVGATATFVNSSLSADEAGARLGSVASGETRILYAAPERLRQEPFVQTLRAIGVGLVVIDEVHCVSMWGHDFRPDYLFIRRALDELDGPAVLGMTATATPAIADAIGQALGRRLELVRTSVHRPNLRYDVERAENAEERLRALLRRLRGLSDGVAIVYARSRRSCEEIARTLRGHGIRAEHYHAGLEPGERTRVQESFVEGRTPVVVATTAFGMGIDKANVRLVALVNYPDSLESYVQMVGRAGRDGLPSDTVLLAGDADASALRRFALGDVPTPDLLRRVYRTVRDSGGTVDAGGARGRGGRRARSARPGRDARAGGHRQARVRRRPRDADRTASGRLGSNRCRGRATRPVPARGGGSCRADPVLREDAALPPPPGRRALRRDPRWPVPRLRRLRPACAAVARDRAGRRSAPRRPREDDRGRRHGPHLAARPAQPGGDAPRLREGSSSARRSPAFGALAAASDAAVTRWIRALEVAGALAEVESDGFRVLRARAGAALPSFSPPASAPAPASLVAELRAWRSRRAREDGVPAYVVLHDATLDELASQRPVSPAELAAVKGLGPAKLDRYGDELLELLATG